MEQRYHQHSWLAACLWGGPRFESLEPLWDWRPGLRHFQMFRFIIVLSNKYWSNGFQYWLIIWMCVNQNQLLKTLSCDLGKKSVEIYFFLNDWLPNILNVQLNQDWGKCVLQTPAVLLKIQLLSRLWILSSNNMWVKC